MKCRLNIILRNEDSIDGRNGILGLAPSSSQASGPLFVDELWE
jgi:hypothetical protein